MSGEIKVNINWHLNTSIEFTANGIYVRVSLNIEPGLAKYLSPNNVTRGKQRTVYALRSFIESDLVCKSNLETIQSALLQTCMRNIRIAKEKRENAIKRINSISNRKI